MKLSSFTPEELQRMNNRQIDDLLKENIPIVRKQVQSVERALGSSQATRMIEDFYPEGIPYYSDIKDARLQTKQKLAHSLAVYERSKTGTVKGAREAINKTLY